MHEVWTFERSLNFSDNIFDFGESYEYFSFKLLNTLDKIVIILSRKLDEKYLRDSLKIRILSNAIWRSLRAHEAFFLGIADYSTTVVAIIHRVDVHHDLFHLGPISDAQEATSIHFIITS